MDPEAILTTVAEVAIALAGFSGIVAVLGSRAGGSWSEVDRFRLSLLLHTSFGAVLWSFAPLVLLSAGIASATVWRTVSGSYAAYLVIVTAVRSRQMLALTRDGQIAVEPRYSTLIVSGAVAALLLQIVNAWSLQTPWPHLVAILWALTVGFMQFVRLLRSSWS